MTVRTRGFTLIELLVVLVIVGIISAVSMPLVGDALGGGAQMRQEARRVLMLLRTARTLSMADKQPRTVEFDVENRMVRFRGEIPEEMGDLSATIRLPEGIRLQAWAAGAEAPEVDEDVEYDVEKTGMPRISFNHAGVSSGMDVRLIRGAFVLRLSCDPLTGEMTVREEVDE